MTRFDDDRVREIPHNPLARAKREDGTKIGVKELISQIDKLTSEAEDDGKLDGSDDPRLKKLLQPAAEKNRKAAATLEKAYQILEDAERIKTNAQADVERKVDEKVDRVCRYREDAYEEGEKSGVKKAESEFFDLVDELRKKYRMVCWMLVFTVPGLVFFLTKALIDLVWRLI